MCFSTLSVGEHSMPPSGELMGLISCFDKLTVQHKRQGRNGSWRCFLLILELRSRFMGCDDREWVEEGRLGRG